MRLLFHSLLERVGEEGGGGSFKSGRPMSRGGKVLDVDGQGGGGS